MSPLIINQPGLQRPLDRALWATVTWAFWSLWFVLWLPLITLIAWGFGIHSGFDQMVNRLGYLELVRLMPNYALVVGGAGLVHIGWAYSQYLRFHGRVPGAVRETVSSLEIAATLGLNPVNLQNWQCERRLTAHHHADGRLLHVIAGEVRGCALLPLPQAAPIEASLARAPAMALALAVLKPPLPPHLQLLPPIPPPPRVTHGPRPTNPRLPRVECRVGCGACCIAPSITSAIPGLVAGKAAGARCIQLTDDHRCAIFSDPRRPSVCSTLRASMEMCGADDDVAATRVHAMAFLTALELATR